MIKNLVLSRAGVMQAQSPLQLSDKGKEILLELKNQEIVTSYKATFFEKLQQEKPDNAYQVQKVIIDILHHIGKEIISSTDYGKIENCAYNFGVSEYDVLSVFALYIRDEYIEQHPEWQADDIDRNDPTKSTSADS